MDTSLRVYRQAPNAGWRKSWAAGNAGAEGVTLARMAVTMTRERVEDYIAAATASGPLMPDKGTREQAAR